MFQPSPKRSFQSEPPQRGAIPPDPILLSVVIVNWNSAQFVRQCLKSMEACPPGAPHEVIVVDSGSYDTCGEMLAREFPQVRFVQSPHNVGFATANNLGAKQARGKFLLFLNPDTEVTASALDQLLAALVRSPDAGLVGARLLNSDGSLQRSCVQAFPTVLNQILDADCLHRCLPRARLWGMAALFEENVRPVPVEVISGACMLVKRAAFESISGFDERYFMYSEDLDLCYRIRQAGFDCLYVSGAKIIHHGGGSSGNAPSNFSVVMMRESVYRLLKRHRGTLTAAGYRAALGASALVRLPLLLLVAPARRTARKGGRFASVRKWLAILRWSLGFESWAAKKSGGMPSAPRPEAHGPAEAAAQKSERSCAA